MATASSEIPTFFRAGDETLFGIMTLPTKAPRDAAVIILPGGGTPLSTNVNRLSVRFGRRIAGEGFHAFRFDYHGAGESTGSRGRFDLGSPFVADLEGAMGLLRADGLRRFVLVGSCFGARTALAAAAENADVIAAVLICPPIRDFEMGDRVATRMARDLTLGRYLQRAARLRTVRRLADGDHRRAYVRIAKEKVRRYATARGSASSDATARYSISARFLGSLRRLVDRNVPTLIMYGEEDDFLADLNAERPSLEPLFERAENVTLHIQPGKLHGFTQLAVQDVVLDVVTGWLGKVLGDKSPLVAT